MNNVYLVSTAHLEKSLWFKDDDDFKVGMNYVAIQAAECPTVEVLSFALMSNHVHFVFCGSRERVTVFVNQFKHRYSMHLNHKYGTGSFLRRNKVYIEVLPHADEAIEKGIAYVHMNPVAANICSHPSQYPWGSGNSIFLPTQMKGQCFGTLSVRAKRRMLHTHDTDIPDDWIVSPDGYILPQSFIAVKEVESIFRTPKRMNYFLVTSSKARKRLESDKNLPAFKDQTILVALPDLCRSIFQKESFLQLSPEEKKELARQLSYRFSADANQIARICGLSYSEAARLLDSL